ncbi:MAG TPA: hypothetical protein VN666_06225 [Nitrospira sp.]|nr:hypothetical protein [Nitrospira sp.]
MAEPPRLIDQVRDLPKKKSYTTVSVKQGFTDKCFNGAKGMTARKIRIWGVKLVWDEYENANPTENPDAAATALNCWGFRRTKSSSREEIVASCRTTGRCTEQAVMK